MRRIGIEPRVHWQALAREYGFQFHTIDGEPYWDEAAYYAFSLRQIEDDLEAPTEELQQMCLDLVDAVVRDEALLQRLAIPQPFWQGIAESWQRRDPSLYSRLDFSYDGKSPAKLLENNADTPTSVYETGFWQWLWLEQQLAAGALPAHADQFNSLQEKLIERFAELKAQSLFEPLYFSCCRDSEEDRGTVQYLMDCAAQAELATAFLYIDEIGVCADGQFTDLQDQSIPWLFKLYPWEFMQRERFGEFAVNSGTQWLEPLWKSVLSNKGILPLLWQRHPHHPNLLPAFFADDPRAGSLRDYVRKPLYSREGANVDMVRGGKATLTAEGPYGAEGFIVQQAQPLPAFSGRFALIGSWLVNDAAAGISVREDNSLITRDSSRFVPHIILD